MKVLLIGEHDKGTGQPFDPSTLSGRRLRGLVNFIGLDPVYANMHACDAAAPEASDIARLLEVAANCGAVVLLGKRVEAAIGQHFPGAHRLPHPASRTPEAQMALGAGLQALAG